MLSSFLRRITSQIKKNVIGPKKIISHAHDVKLIQQVRGRKFPKFGQVLNINSLFSTKERKIFKISLVILIVGVAWAIYAILGHYSVAAPAVGGRYVEAVVGGPQFVNPLFSSVNDVDVDLVRLVYSGLMKYDLKQRLVPDMAVNYELNEDQKTYTFHIKEGMVWHDSKPITAEDIVFTIETIQDELVNSPLILSFKGVEVKALDEHTVQFKLQEPFSSFLSVLTVGILPKHVWIDVPAEQMRLTQKNLRPIGSGPFKFKKMTKDQSGYIISYELARFEEYYRQSPFLEEFVFNFYIDYEGPGGAITALREQKVDGLHFVPYDLREQATRKHINLHTLQLPQYTAVLFNQKNKLALHSQNVRKALALAIDKDRILRESLNNEGQIIYGPILPGFPGYDPEIEKTVYSADEANDLLDETDWKRISAEEFFEKRKTELVNQWKKEQTSFASSTPEVEGDNEVEKKEIEVPEEILSGIVTQLENELDPAQTFYRLNKDGEILQLLLVTSETSEYIGTARLISGMWQEIGAKTNVSVVPSRDFSYDVLKNRKYDVLLYGMIVGDDPDQYPFWHSSQIDFPGLNLAQYFNRNVDEILEKTRETIDEEEKVSLYKNFQDTLSEDLPAVFLYMPTYTYALSDKVKGFDIGRISRPADRFNNIINWYMNTKNNWNF
ncbi:MAG: hypothetical protein COX81_02910 [Candidatus Magasanikbacteria bacterium CG_4_10_14_0_2_um_filter_37_12]|uniref:Solute-binding protein family 5 domain-containing protein n=1 Tax=Candidatus Magasanikbacteria bacterium CG_4_10_14_0_2_um_filter_37_12 TaxID=1974637 RepID=A0A2M7V7L3_9BACT|nr:MAG: hypothetical protein COX81_02910 [Candidatus Magasanikbacteria bacterium CG_4_10_14_0_2_um_filter_37_12]